MDFKRKTFSFTSVLLVILFGTVAASSLKVNGGRKKKVDAIQKFFPHENSLCVVLEEPFDDEFLPVFQVPVVVYTRDHLLQNCEQKTTDQDGYVLVTSTTVKLEEKIVPLLECFNRTTLKLKTKYILLLDISKSTTSNHQENYSTFFHNLWKSFGIINIAILPIHDQNTEQPLVFSYNPFLAAHNKNLSALKNSPIQDVRGVMTDRFRNMHGHRLTTVFFGYEESLVTLKELSKKQSLGAFSGVLFKQVLEEKLNVGFDIYEASKKGGISLKDIGEEFFSGRAEYCTNLYVVQPYGELVVDIGVISTGSGAEVVFVVPTPRRIESWRYFRYIFQWQVCVGVVIVLFSLSAAALLFQYIQSTQMNSLSQNTSGTSEVVSVWRAALSVGINRLPTTHSQRLLITWSLLLGLIFVTLFSAKLFNLIKAKPRLPSIRTLQDLHDSDLPIYLIFPQFLPYFNVFENTTLHKLKENIKNDEMYENAQYDPVNPKYLNITDRALLCSTGIVKLVVSLRRNQEFLQYFEVVQEPMFRSTLAAYLPIGSVYYDHFNLFNLRLVSGGFYIKWDDAKGRRLSEQFISSSPPVAPPASKPTAADDNEPLKYDDLKMAFYALYLGLSISTLCFVIEVCHFKMMHWFTSHR